MALPLLRRLLADFSHRVALEFNAMSMMQDTITDGVGQGRVRQIIVPERRSELTRDHGRPEVVAILEDFEQILAVLVLDRRQPPIVEHEDIDAREARQEARIGPGGPRQRKFVEQPRGTPIECAIALSAGLVR